MTRKRLLKTQDEKKKKKKTQDGCDTETVANENYNSLMLTGPRQGIKVDSIKFT